MNFSGRPYLASGPWRFYVHVWPCGDGHGITIRFGPWAIVKVW